MLILTKILKLLPNVALHHVKTHGKLFAMAGLVIDFIDA